MLTETSPRVLFLQRRRQEVYTYRDVAKSVILTETSPRVLCLKRRRQECNAYRDVSKSAIPTETSPRVLYLQRRRQECYTYRDVAKSAIYTYRDVAISGRNATRKLEKKRRKHNNKLFTSTCPSSSTEWTCLSKINSFTA